MKQEGDIFRHTSKQVEVHMCNHRTYFEFGIRPLEGLAGSMALELRCKTIVSSSAAASSVAPLC